MEFIKKVTQRLLRVRKAGRRFLKEDGLINTTDLLVATAATVVLAAGVGGTVLATLDESKYGKAQPDAQSVGQAIMSFYKDTGKWPGQAYHATHTSEAVILATAAYTSTTTTSTTDPVTEVVTTTTTTSLNGSVLPDVANNGLKWTALNATRKCAANSGQGFVNATIAGYASSATTTVPISGVTVLNLNDYLVRQPDTSMYPNWGGPYVQEITSDPWERAWVVYLTPLYCSEAITATDGTGSLGYAWLLAGGTNRTITTPATFSNLDPFGDDAGVNLGKLSVVN